ncbi:hypothetical protein BBBOND_0301350 [Babesia bigemina]|uniref:Uncharacterized protein n=1 Tax=Babesia bigemina TaxID=5866 RepID=A0A061D6B5_BABBI|nr:hypothetical protein BBBOND_0301350 [Babesia bigemina]CDR96231.1 hypothetical protein BBBOND_0301350 [Babesia bigemina]|eukprot:XP_012768417.1 hypothetical protein BBBOND_0301350 [Babesia bigemina]
MANSGRFVDELASNADASQKFSEIAEAVVANTCSTKTGSKKLKSPSHTRVTAKQSSPCSTTLDW